ncbi:MAG TPA: response regulator [Steroidobacter sp.]|uniref:response regulator transcription factor n=1 Tax=Steroidobacter sp. TaxID=1978227 RepID=UPI002ED7A351
MKDPSKLIAVVDDDESVREALPDLLREFGFAAISFDAAEAFLSSDMLDRVRCLILDIAMPGMTGPELQQELVNRGLRIPVIFITAHADANVRAGLLQKGAVECLFKPFGDQDLRAALDRALATS